MWYHGTRVGESTIVVNYNDHNGNNYSGVSCSTDEGNTFTQILPPPFATGHGTNYGDPILVFNSNLDLWFAGDLVSGCGGQGIGLWSSPNCMNWTPVLTCAHVNSADDRLSMWVDNDPASSQYGRMYISFNTFNLNNS